MVRNAIRFVVGIAFLIALLGQVSAPGQDVPKKGKKGDKGEALAPDDYRRLFKKPETVAEFWKAMQFEIEVGRFDLAARLLHGLLDKNPDDKSLLDLGRYKRGDLVVIVAGAPPGTVGSTNLIHVHRIGEDDG